MNLIILCHFAYQTQVDNFSFLFMINNSLYFFFDLNNVVFFDSHKFPIPQHGKTEIGRILKVDQQNIFTHIVAHNFNFKKLKKK